MEQHTVNQGSSLLARLDRIPVWPYPRLLLWVVGFGFFFAYFDIVTIGFALPVIVQQFGVSSAQAAWTITSSLLGYILGALLDSLIADRFGRRLSLVISVTLFTVGSLLSATSPQVWWLVGWRFLSGMGIGAEIAAVSTYIGELAPAPLRGQYTGWTVAAGFLGLSVVPLVALGLVPHYTWGWRALFVIGGLGGGALLWMRRGLPASPHWLVTHGRTAEAEALVAQAEQTARQRLGRDLPPPGPAVLERASERGALRDLLRPPYAGRLGLFVVVWFVYYLGNYGWMTLAPTLLVEKGYSLAHSLAFMLITGIGFVVGAVAAVFVSDRLERRASAAVIALVWTVALAAIGGVASGGVIVIGGFVASSTIGLLVPILYTYTAEHFATRFRATGVAVTDGLGHLGGALAPAVVLAAHHRWGFAGAFYVMASTGLVTALLLTRAVRTTGRALERIAP